jgi:hypothetical protein
MDYRYCLLVALLCCCFFDYVTPDSDCYSPTKLGEDRRQEQDYLTFVQYNAEWLFLDYYKSSNCPGAGCAWADVEEAQAHLEHIAGQIALLNPDIINLVEVVCIL